MSDLAGRVARAMGGAGEAEAHARRAGLLSKCDLLTEMVGEFPELQGEMGREYARLDGEPAAVADAIGEVYLPRFAADAIPATAAGRAVAIADKLDTIAGCLSLGQVPTGDKDPFALRRAALGALRIMIEGGLDLDLGETIEAAFECYAAQAREASGGGAGEGRPGRPDAMVVSDVVVSDVMASPGAGMEVRRFMLDRLRAYFADRSIPTDVFNAVLATEPARPLDFAHRVRAVEAFRTLPEAASLAAANKRIRNILRQAGRGEAEVGVAEGARKQAGGADGRSGASGADGGGAASATSGAGGGDGASAASVTGGGDRASGAGAADGVDRSLLREDAERSLLDALAGIEPRARAMLDAGEYTDALASLAGLRDDVDRFFDTVKVMDDDAALRGNRLALLARIGALFMETADISILQPANE